MRALLVVVLVLTMAGCASRRPAPVVDRAPVEVAPQPVVEAPRPPEPPPAERPLPTYTVKRGDTMVGIALQFGLVYRELAAWNNVTNVNAIRVGQVLVVARPANAPAMPMGSVATPLSSSGPMIEARPLSNSPVAKVEPRGEKLPFSDRALAQLGSPATGEAPAIVEAAPAPPGATPARPMPPPAAEPERASGTDTEDVDWMWPVKGKVLAPVTEATKGVDIGGRKGAAVLAAAAGRVVYAGSGLRGYGKLVIIKHNNTWLSAYAHNENVLVKEQQDVRRGQKIAEMGSTDTDQVKLHFEVRRQGKPVDPAKVLPSM